MWAGVTCSLVYKRGIYLFLPSGQLTLGWDRSLDLLAHSKPILEISLLHELLIFHLLWSAFKCTVAVCGQTYDELQRVAGHCSQMSVHNISHHFKPKQRGTPDCDQVWNGFSPSGEVVGQPSIMLVPPPYFTSGSMSMFGLLRCFSVIFWCYTTPVAVQLSLWASSASLWWYHFSWKSMSMESSYCVDSVLSFN